MVFISDGALEELVVEKLQNRFWLASANVINHPLLSAVHAHKGAMHAFAQDIIYDDLSLYDTVQWRTKSSAPIVIPWTPDNATKLDSSVEKRVHRWAPLATDPPTSAVQALAQQGISFGYGAFDHCSFMSWKCATIAHYSFFRNLEEGEHVK